MVAPLHLLLFGSRRVDAIDNETVRLDNWLNFRMNPYHASLITALRPAVENLIISSSESPDEVINLDQTMACVVSTVKDLCILEAGDFEIEREKGPTPSDGRSGMPKLFGSGGSGFAQSPPNKRPFSNSSGGAGGGFGGGGYGGNSSGYGGNSSGGRGGFNQNRGFNRGGGGGGGFGGRGGFNNRRY